MTTAVFVVQLGWPCSQEFWPLLGRGKKKPAYWLMTRLCLDHGFMEEKEKRRQSEKVISFYSIHFFPFPSRFLLQLLFKSLIQTQPNPNSDNCFSSIFVDFLEFSHIRTCLILSTQ